MTVKATPPAQIPSTAAGIAKRSKRFFLFTVFACAPRRGLSVESKGRVNRSVTPFGQPPACTFRPCGHLALCSSREQFRFREDPQASAEHRSLTGFPSGDPCCVYPGSEQ